MKVEHAIHVAAPPDAVWAATVDVERWPEWMPTMDRVKRVDAGPFDVGSSARIKQPGLPETEWTVTDLVHGQRFSWTTRVLGIRMRATHELSPHEGGTRNVLRVEMAGPVAVLLAPFARRSVRRTLERENAAFKERCEAAP